MNYFTIAFPIEREYIGKVISAVRYLSRKYGVSINFNQVGYVSIKVESDRLDDALEAKVETQRIVAKAKVELEKKKSQLTQVAPEPASVMVPEPTPAPVPQTKKSMVEVMKLWKMKQASMMNSLALIEPTLILAPPPAPVVDDSLDQDEKKSREVMSSATRDDLPAEVVEKATFTAAHPIEKQPTQVVPSCPDPTPVPVPQTKKSMVQVMKLWKLKQASMTNSLSVVEPALMLAPPPALVVDDSLDQDEKKSREVKSPAKSDDLPAEVAEKAIFTASYPIEKDYLGQLFGAVTCLSFKYGVEINFRHGFVIIRSERNRRCGAMAAKNEIKNLIANAKEQLEMEETQLAKVVSSDPEVAPVTRGLSDEMMIQIDNDWDWLNWRTEESSDLTIEAVDDPLDENEMRRSRKVIWDSLENLLSSKQAAIMTPVAIPQTKKSMVEIMQLWRMKQASMTNSLALVETTPVK